MRALFRITLSFTVLAWCAMAQHGGGGHGGGGFSHASAGGGFHGGGSVASGYRGGYGYGGSRGYRGYGYGGYGYGRGYYGYRGGFWPYYGWGWGYPWWGYGYSYWPGYYYGYPYGYDYSDTYVDPGYAYAPGPTVAYSPDPPAQAPASATHTSPAHPVTHSYDQYGQEVAGGGESAANSSPIYLLAMKDGGIQAAASYAITGDTLHYVTMDHQEKQVPLSSIDRALTQQLNRERRVRVALPQQ